MLETPQSPQVIYSIAVLLPLGLERFFLKGFFAFFFPFASNSISWFTMRSHNHHRPGEHVPPFPFCKPYNPLIIFFFSLLAYEILIISLFPHRQSVLDPNHVPAISDFFPCGPQRFPSRMFNLHSVVPLTPHQA